MTLSSTERPCYGTAHQRRREELLPAAIGQPCPFCGIEMRIGQALDLDHSSPESKRRGEPGDRIAHALCNRAGRASYGELRSSVRNCEICGALFASRSRETRTCSRACGMELKRRNRPPVSVKVRPTYSRRCTECGTDFTTAYAHQKTCSEPCSRRRMHRWQPAPAEPSVGIPGTCKDCGVDIPPSGKPGRPKTLCAECRRPNDYQPTT